MAKRRGAPQKPQQKRRTELLPIRLTKVEKTLVDQAADGKTSTWARGVLLRAARRKTK
ncbi:MAG: hypothetical protein ACYSWU_15635 [Planctomycetota bacterium]